APLKSTVRAQNTIKLNCAMTAFFYLFIYFIADFFFCLRRSRFDVGARENGLGARPNFLYAGKTLSSPQQLFSSFQICIIASFFCCLRRSRFDVGARENGLGARPNFLYAGKTLSSPHHLFSSFLFSIIPTSFSLTSDLVLFFPLPLSYPFLFPPSHLSVPLPPWL